jgi:hypothetical protein
MKMISLKVSELPFELERPMLPDDEVILYMSDCEIQIDNIWGQHLQDVTPNYFIDEWFCNLPEERFFELEETQVKYTVAGELRNTNIPMSWVNLKDSDVVRVTLNNIRLTVTSPRYSMRTKTTDEIRNNFDNIRVALNH